MQAQQQILITENKYIQPLEKVLNNIPPESTETPKKHLTESVSFKESLDNLFPEQQRDEKAIKRAKDILGTVANNFTPGQLKDTVTEIQFLSESWLDDFERKIFNGLTLNELLHEKGGL